MKTREWNRRDRLDNEFWLLQQLAGVMEKANFHEVPQAVITRSLAEHSSHNVIVGVIQSMRRAPFNRQGGGGVFLK